MNLSFIATALMAVSLITNLTVEVFKKILDDAKVKYSSNVLAAAVSIIVAVVISGGYIVMTDIVFSTKVAVQVVVLMYLSFLASTVGYDKIIQTLSQIKGAK